jgi:hypothetical protein
VALRNESNYCGAQRSVDLLNEGLRVRFFPELWEIRSQMTDHWAVSMGLFGIPSAGTDAATGPRIQLRAGEMA